MLGRGTRRCPDIHKENTVFDCFDGTLSYFKGASDMEDSTREVTMPIEEVVDHIWNNRQKDYYTSVLVKRLQRKAKQLSGPGYAAMEAFGIPGGDLSAWAAKLPSLLQSDILGTMKPLRDPKFWDKLAEMTVVQREFMVAGEQTDTVSSEVLFRVGKDDLRPADYLERFAEYVRDNPDGIEAIEVLKSRPKEWRPESLQKLRDGLSRHSFEEGRLKKATFLAHGKGLSDVDVISLVKHAANDKAPLISARERVEGALSKVREGRTFSLEQEEWLARIKAHLIENLAIGLDDFDYPVFAAFGGLGKVTRVFTTKTLRELVERFNMALAS